MEDIIDEKQKFIDIMKNIKVGDVVKFYRFYYGTTEIKSGTVKSITSCHVKKNRIHEGCEYCVGNINLDIDSAGGCFKRTSEWKTRIVAVIDNNFIQEDEFTI